MTESTSIELESTEMTPLERVAGVRSEEEALMGLKRWGFGKDKRGLKVKMGFLEMGFS